VGNSPRWFILNATFINATPPAAGGVLYKYIVQHVNYEGFNPHAAQVGGVETALLLKPKNVTYTSGLAYCYVITHDSKT